MAKSVMRKAKNTIGNALTAKSLPSEKSHLGMKEDTYDLEKKWDREDESDSFKKRTMDAITETLGCTSYFSKMTWPWLKQEVGGMKYRMAVDRFYQERNLAIDFKETNPDHLKAKKALCEENGIQYALISDSDKLKELARGLS